MVIELLTIRIIPCLDVDNGQVVKGTRFKELKYAGEPVELARKYYLEGADELTFLDIGASPREEVTVLDLVRKVAREIFIPLTVGGGIRSTEDMRKALEAGADKVAICTAALKNPELVIQGAHHFGSQCIVLSIDAGFCGDTWYAFSHGGRKNTGKPAIEWALEGQALGAGEILLNSIDQDGTQDGYDLELLKEISSRVSIPVIASGGAGKLEHLAEGVTVGGADAILVASLLHYKQTSIPAIKEFLEKKGVPVRC